MTTTPGSPGKHRIDPIMADQFQGDGPGCAGNKVIHSNSLICLV